MTLVSGLFGILSAPVIGISKVGLSGCWKRVASPPSADSHNMYSHYQFSEVFQSLGRSYWSYNSCCLILNSKPTVLEDIFYAYVCVNPIPLPSLDIVYGTNHKLPPSVLWRPGATGMPNIRRQGNKKKFYISNNPINSNDNNYPLNHCFADMSAVVRRIAASHGLRSHWLKSHSAAYRVLVDRNTEQNFRAFDDRTSKFQKRFQSESAATTMTLPDHLVSEIASEDDSAPSEELKSLVNMTEKTFKIIDEPGRGELLTDTY